MINDIATWCEKNFLTLNLEKTQFIQFLTNNKKKKLDVQVKVAVKEIPNTSDIKFLGLIIDIKLKWKKYRNELNVKLNKACYALRSVKALVSTKTLITIYFTYFHSLLRYGITFCGNSPIEKEIFIIQKETIRIIANISRRNSCRLLFNQFQILTLPCQYIFSILAFVIENRNLFVLNSDIHDHNTRNVHDIHSFSTHLLIVQRGVIHSGSKIFNRFPSFIRRQRTLIILRNYLKNYLLEKSFYNLEEYYQFSAQETVL